MYNVGDWLDFAYYNCKLVRYDRWVGEVKKIMHYPADSKRKGYLLMTRDGYKHFKMIKMEDVNLVKRPE
jgi:hypothetical protein